MTIIFRKAPTGKGVEMTIIFREAPIGKWISFTQTIHKFWSISKINGKLHTIEIRGLK